MVVHAYNFSTCGVEARGSEAQGPQLYEFETSLHEVHLKKQKKKKENLKQKWNKTQTIKMWVSFRRGHCLPHVQFCRAYSSHMCVFKEEAGDSERLNTLLPGFTTVVWMCNVSYRLTCLVLSCGAWFESCITFKRRSLARASGSLEEALERFCFQICLSLYSTFVHLPSETRRHQIPGQVVVSYCGCREQNSGPLEKQQILLSAKSQLLRVFITWSHFLSAPFSGCKHNMTSHLFLLPCLLRYDGLDLS